MSNNLANTVETVTLAGAYALTSCATGLAIDAMMPAEIPEADPQLMLQLAAQFGLGVGLVTEIYRAILSFRSNDAPLPIGDGLPWFFFFMAQPNFLKKVGALNERMRNILLSKVYPIPQTPDVGAASEGGNPVGVINE